LPEGFVLDAEVVFGVLVRKRVVLMAPADEQVAAEVVIVLREHSDNVVGRSIFQETGVSEGHLSVYRSCLHTAVHPEMGLTFGTIF
jgi:hypothetical protein